MPLTKQNVDKNPELTSDTNHADFVIGHAGGEQNITNLSVDRFLNFEIRGNFEQLPGPFLDDAQGDRQHQDSQHENQTRIDERNQV